MTHADQPTRVAWILAQLLERMDASAQTDPHQYQMVASRLERELDNPAVNWEPLLARSPAAAQLYENMHYAAAGLCRSPLGMAARAEVAARDAIATAQRRSATGRFSPDAAAA